MADSHLSKVISELNKSHPDLEKVQQLIINYQDTTETDLVRFRVNGTLINRLGAELVEKKETAICELIKNSYDADAKEVTVDFVNVPKKEKLIITDLGSGMTREQIIHGFMVIGTQNKLDEPVSPILKRKRAGSKGIGRIAAFRLGKTLTIETKSAKSKTGYKVKIDWTKFDESEDITSVRFPIEEGSFVDKGTRLTIENLNDTWDKELVQGVYKYVEDLLQPEVVSKDLQIDVDSFDVKFNFRTPDQTEAIQKKGKIIFDYAHAEIDSYVTNSGIHKINFISKPYDLKEKLNGDSKFENLSGVYFKAYYFLHGKAGMVRGINKKKINELLDQGRFGIRVYRNGFRVLPFGEPDNDWLGLDQYEGKRRILVPLGNKNFFGFISIHDPDDDKRFIETSNREGFVHNSIFEELVTFGLETCIKVGSTIGELRGKKIYATQKDFKSGSGGSPKIKLIEIENQLTHLLTEEVSKQNERVAKDEDKVTEIHNQIKSHVKSAMTAIRRQYVEPTDRYSTALLEENSMLRILATLGISVGEFTHEMRLFVPALENDVDNLEDIVKEFAAKKILSRMRQNISGLSNYIGFFDNTIVQNNDRTLENHDLHEIVREFAERMDADFKKSGISFTVETRGSSFLTIPMHYSEWTSILFNFYTNAKKAIKASNVHGNISVGLSKESNKIVLDFQDNGSGVSDSIKNKIFDAFVTSTKTSDQRRKKSNDISGSGLGLWIVRQILQNYGGEVKLVEPRKGFKTCFRITIPKK